MKKNTTNQMRIAQREVEQRLEAAERDEDCTDLERLVISLTPDQLQSLLDRFADDSMEQAVTTLPCVFDWTAVPGPTTVQ